VPEEVAVKILILVVGSVKGPVAPAVAEYESRAGRYWKLETAEVDAGAPGRNPAPERVKQEEGERILARIPDRFQPFVLTRGGKQMRSKQLARCLNRAAVEAWAGVAFIIGGAFGVSDAVLAAARKRLSLSAMTLPHEMARLVLAEQLYRAGTILRNEPYHKGA
jgi:23S rRNA (pseudouridine1915-N3)-methyltransferase